MRLSEGLGLRAVLVLLLALGISSHVGAESVLVNGSFETGDYSGWVLVEGEGASPTDGTSGITQDGMTIYRSDEVFDFYDLIPVAQDSSGLPRTYTASDGSYLAIQLQNDVHEHRMFQDVSLPENAKTLSWDMFYENMNEYFSPDQYLALHVRDLNDNILETLFLTEDSSPLAIPMSNFAVDISSHAGSTVRIDIEQKVHLHFFYAGFDNFRIELGEGTDEVEAPASALAPPGWSRSKGKKLGWSEYKKFKEPRGFEKGQKNGWK
jgi:hypothetical protein